MAKARKVKEISFSMTNRVGLLSDVTTAIAKAKVNLSAICAYAMGNTGYFMVTTDSNAKAKKALTSLGVQVEEREVVEVEIPNKPGALQKVAQKIADAGIDIEYMYATAGVGKTVTGVFKTPDSTKTMKAINQ